MQTLAEIRTEILRLKWHVAAWRFQRALRRHALALKAGFNPEQPRDELGRWVEAGREEEERDGGAGDDVKGSAIVEQRAWESCDQNFRHDR